MRWGLVLSVMLMSCSALRAAVIIASDNASDPAYASGWTSGANGGSGWGGGWSFVNQSNVALGANTSNRGSTIGNSTGNDNTAGDTNADGDINSTGGKAWGLYSNTTDHAYAVRPLASTLQIGQTIGFDIDNGNIASTQVVGLRLLSNAADITSRVWEFRFVGGDPDYTVIANPNTTSTMTFTREGVHVDYTLTGASTFTLAARRLVDGATYTLNGTNANANSIAGIAFKNQLAGSGATADAFLNNITVSTVPEPVSLGLISIAPFVLSCRKRRMR